MRRRDSITQAPLASILVQVNIDEVVEGCVNVAVELASRFGASLIGVCACALQPIPVDDMAVGAMGLIQDPSEIKDQLEAVRKEFARLTEGKAKSVEWRSAIDQPSDYAAINARAADLLIVGPSRVDSVYRSVRPADLIMRAGRPVLVVPDNVSQIDQQRVVVGWKDTREARRAVLDSLPLLQAATEVTVVAVTEEANAPAVQSANDVANFLGRHGVDATGISVDAHGNAADRIITLAKERGADLIVAGAYGHARLREWVFGGVTRDLLTRSPFCCLMSH